MSHSSNSGLHPAIGTAILFVVLLMTAAVLEPFVARPVWATGAFAAAVIAKLVLWVIY